MRTLTPRERRLLDLRAARRRIDAELHRLEANGAGRPRLPEQFTEEQRRDGHARYRAGDRNPQTVAAEREYQRVNKGRNRAGKNAGLST